MVPTQELFDQLYREKILVARRMTPEERVLGCFELTEFVRQVMTDGVRDQFPEADEEEVQAIVRKRVAIVKRNHERR